MDIKTSDSLSNVLSNGFSLELLDKIANVSNMSIPKAAEIIDDLLQSGVPPERIIQEYQPQFPPAINNCFNKPTLETNKKGLAECTIENFYRIFSEDPYYSTIRFNLLTNTAEITTEDKSGNAVTKQMDDADLYDSMRYIQNEYWLYSPKMHEAGLRLMLRDREYHPIQELINNFVWDGRERCENFLHQWMKAEDNPYTREVSRLIFAGGINRLYSPGCKFDCVPVLIGTQQGEGKSSIISMLAIHDSFSKVIDLMDGSQRSIEGLSGVWIAEISELAALRKSDVESIKSFITRTFDQYRKPYDRQVSVLPRRCIFLGSTNNRQFLSDKTGNRRFFPVEIHSDGYEILKHQDEIREYINQCWAEALNRYKSGDMPPFAKRELIDNYRSAQEAAEVDDWRVGTIEEYLRTVPNDSFICIREIFKRALYPNSELEPKRTDQIEIAQILDSMPDWERCEKRERISPYGRQRCWRRKSVHFETEIEPQEQLPF